MKYRKLFFLSLPLSLLGLGKIIGHHHHRCGGHHFHNKGQMMHGHMMKFFAWRLGLSPEQKGKIDELFNGMKTEYKPFTEKHHELRRILTQEFRKDQFEASKVSEQCSPEILDKGPELFVKSIKGVHDILTPMQREKVAAHFERCHCC